MRALRVPLRPPLPSVPLAPSALKTTSRYRAALRSERKWASKRNQPLPNHIVSLFDDTFLAAPAHQPLLQSISLGLMPPIPASPAAPACELCSSSCLCQLSLHSTRFSVVAGLGAQDTPSWIPAEKRNVVSVCARSLLQVASVVAGWGTGTMALNQASFVELLGLKRRNLGL